MKRNGAGLASICVLATMVLVMLSSTLCLHFGARDSFAARYPRVINVEIGFRSQEGLDERVDDLRARLNSVLDQRGMAPERVMDYCNMSVYGVLRDGELVYDHTTAGMDQLTLLEQVVEITFVDMKQVFPDEADVPESDHVFICTWGISYERDHISIGGQTYTVDRTLSEVPGHTVTSVEATPIIYVVTPAFQEVTAYLLSLTQNQTGSALSPVVWHYAFDVMGEADEITACVDDLRACVRVWGAEGSGYSYSSITAREDELTQFFSMTSGFLFLGILLSIVFLMATALIIYFKQLSQGYEDQGRFGILRKVGMTDRDIRRSINTQMRIVFFFPLGLAVLHLAFAFPMISKLLVLFSVNNTPFLLLMASLSVLGFAVFYVLVYRATAGMYYRLVHDGKQE